MEIIQLFIYSCIFVNSLIFINLTHPLTMGLTLLIQTSLICFLTGIMTKTFWFSYILFLIFMGGMLVLFIYVTSLASNEMFNLSIKLILISLSILFIFFIFFYFFDKMYSSYFFMNNEMKMLSNSISFFSENCISLNKIYNFPTNFLTILLMNYLLITLIVVVKITKLFKGPLRLMN